MKVADERHNLKNIKDVCKKHEAEHVELMTSADDFDHEIHCSRTKQKMFDD